jgi:T5orf172 domain
MSETFSPITIIRSADDAPLGGRMLRAYAIGFSDGLVKIGITTNLPRRITQICGERRSLGIQSEIEAISYTAECYNAREIERYLLEYLGRAHGEYVRASFDFVVSVMRRVTVRTTQTANEIAAEKRREDFVRKLLSFACPKELPPLPESYHPMQQFLDCLHVSVFTWIKAGVPEGDAVDALAMMQDVLSDWVNADERATASEMVVAAGNGIKARWASA